MKTQIICTIGPSSFEPDIIEKMANQGMTIARVNASHGTAEQTRQTILHLGSVRASRKLDYKIMLDTKGPDIRIGKFADGFATLEEGRSFRLYSEEMQGDEQGVFVRCPQLFERSSLGQVFLLNDGMISVVVTDVNERRIKTKVMVGGTLSSNKTLFAPGLDVGLPFVSPADREDLAVGIDTNIDIIAASFVGSKGDLDELYTVLGTFRPKIISKIESSSGIENIDEILSNCDGIMIARGDLGVEYPVEKIPNLQKFLSKKAIQHGKFCITATEMMESMIKKPRPTRAEVADVALAVWQGTSAVMLSAESAVGKYPVAAVSFLSRIILENEKS